MQTRAPRARLGRVRRQGRCRGRCAPSSERGARMRRYTRAMPARMSAPGRCTSSSSSRRCSLMRMRASCVPRAHTASARRQCTCSRPSAMRRTRHAVRARSAREGWRWPSTRRHCGRSYASSSPRSSCSYDMRRSRRHRSAPTPLCRPVAALLRRCRSTLIPSLEGGFGRHRRTCRPQTTALSSTTKHCRQRCPLSRTTWRA
mmetsp:Transcript_8397/g.34089  ORF Transcript_8397/g.34089 Transcript_8397/m.34089 type:complete len:202 (-) Transcript_8397:1604-2209(-)